MDTTYCKHLRIRGDRDYETDLEKFIKVLERQYNFDFRSLPEWKKLIDVMNVVRTQYQQKLKDAAKREFQIIETLQKEFSRPIELSHKLAKAAKRWELLYSNKRKRKVPIPSYHDVLLLDQQLKGDIEYLSEESDVKSTAHPNTEVIQSKDVLVTKLDMDSDLKTISSPQLPVSICTNQHKKLSSIGSKYSALSHVKSNHFPTTIKSDSSKDGIIFWHQIKDIQVNPSEVTLDMDTNKKQILKLCITNCGTEFLHLRFKSILEPFYLKAFKIMPALPVKLYPGLTFAYKLMFKLKEPIETTEIKSALRFKVGRNVFSEGKEDMQFHVPIVSKIIEADIFSVIKTVNIPPAYKWHVSAKNGYPRGLGYVYINDDNQYHMHVRKRDVVHDLENSNDSVEVITPDSESLVLREEEIDKDAQNEALLIHKHTPVEETDTLKIVIKTSDIVTLLLEDIIELSFQPFVFKHTYLRLLPKCKKIFEIYLTKSDYVGFYNAYYDLEFQNAHTNEVVMTKTIKVFGEILPPPIKLKPQILDMTNSPITFGVCKDYFTIVNNHKICPITIKIKTTTKMQRLFKITPMETFVPGKSRAHFEVRLCLKNCKENDSNELSYFTIKIIISGDKSIYQHFPPIFYEIIAPCAKEFKRIYGKKYFRDISD